MGLFSQCLVLKLNISYIFFFLLLEENIQSVLMRVPTISKWHVTKKKFILFKKKEEENKVL